MQFLITISIFPMLELKSPDLSSPSCSIEIPVSNNCAATDSRCCAVFGGRLQTTDNNSFKSSSTVFTLGQDSLRGNELCPWKVFLIVDSGLGLLLASLGEVDLEGSDGDTKPSLPFNEESVGSPLLISSLLLPLVLSVFFNSKSNEDYLKESPLFE